MAIYTLKNRWKEPFRGQWDGQVYEVVDTLACLDYIAMALKRQSIIRDNPITGDNDYKLAILELGDKTDPLTEIPVEALDRSDMDTHKKVVHIPSGVNQPRPGQRIPVYGSDPVRTTE